MEIVLGEIVLGDRTEWVIVGGVIGSLMLLEFTIGLGFKMYTRITFGVIKNLTDIKHTKECIRNIYTNLAAVAALILTMVLSTLFLTEHLGEPKHPRLHTVFVATCSFSCMQCLRATMECVINIVYTEALNNLNTMRYLIANPASVGGPTLAIALSISSMVICTTVWLLQMYTVAVATGFALLGLYIVGLLCDIWHSKLRFTLDKEEPRSKKWTWAETQDEKPEDKRWDDDKLEIIRKRMRDARAASESREPTDVAQQPLLR